MADNIFNVIMQIENIKIEDIKPYSKNAKKHSDVIVQRYVDYTGNKEIIKNKDKIIWD
jgi:hypothetical protein